MPCHLKPDFSVRDVALHQWPGNHVHSYSHRSTTLAGDDTSSNVKRLCFKAKSAVQQDILKDLELDDLKITTGCVCVYPNRVAEAVKYLEGTGIPVASVAAGFPAGQTPMK